MATFFKSSGWWLLLYLVLPAPGIAARDWYVATNGSHGVADTWSSALTNLQTAIDGAGEGASKT